MSSGILEKEKEIREYYDNLGRKLKKQININSTSEAKDYILKLKEFKEYESRNIGSVSGGEVKKYLYSQLTVGSDSQYSEKLHFIYELIQNVDDCCYEDASDCNLTINFNDKEKTITLEYNEKGFTTENVFAISSIANSSKNKEGNEMKIGEKGIGFKSVFGIAKKVLIQSGYFSFSFDTTDFIIPMPEYDNYSYTTGTKLTLFLMENESNKLFNEIARKYNHGKNYGNYLNDNPVIFLNNLTSICYKNNDEYISFGVSRENLLPNQFCVEENVKISIEKNINNRLEKFELECFRFSKEITYNQEQCNSRYPDREFTEKKHKIIALALKKDNFKGSVYSFLPTRIRTNVPIIFHIPFKLKASREEIDDQNKNAWFKKTIKELQVFVKEMYYQLSRLAPESILNYIPKRDDKNIFKSFYVDSTIFNKKEFMLRGSNIYNDGENFISEYRIIKGIDNEYHSLNEMVYVGNIDKFIAQEVLELLNKQLHVFAYDKNISIKSYGIKEESDLLNQLATAYLKSGNNEDSIMRLFDNIDFNIIDNQVNLLSENNTNNYGKLEISVDKLKHIFDYNNFKKLIMNLNLSPKKESLLRVVDEYKLSTYIKSDSAEEFIYQSIKPNANKSSSGYIYKLANHKFEKISFLKDDDYFVTEDCFYYSNLIKSIENNLNIYSKKLNFNDQENIAKSFVIIEGNNYDLKNNLKDNKDKPEDFINTINQMNDSSKKLLGKTYEKILKILDNSSISSDVYINELLQNANDVKYPKNVSHKFNLGVVGNDLVVSYNEIGFSKEDIVAITDIGESTKIKVVESEGYSKQIGEKGIGFKSVFKIARSVDIHSGEFHFTLKKSTPTIPEWISNQPYQNGTKIVLHLDKPFEKDFTNKQLIELVLGLANIDEFDIFGTTILVDKENNQRNYLINDELYEYYVFTNKGEVEKSALEERRRNKPNEADHQEVEIIFPKEITSKTKGKVYCGLPTTVDTTYPFSINANFELNTSREGIVQNNWNNEIICIVSLAILEAYDFLKTIIGLDVLKYITIGQVILDPNEYYSKHYNYLKNRLAMKQLLKNYKDEWISFENAIVVDQLEIDVLEAYGDDIDDNYVSNISIEKYQIKSILKELGVCFHTDVELIDELVIQNDLLINNVEIRKKFYEFIKKYNHKEDLFEYFQRYKLIPYKLKNNAIGLIEINDDLYYSDTKKSIISEENLFYILDTNYLDSSTYDEIVSNHENYKIQRFEKQEFEKYQCERIRRWLYDIDDLEERAEKLLMEYNERTEIMKKVFEQFDNDDLEHIVFKMQDGSFKTNEYISYIHSYSDTLFDDVFISDEYTQMAKVLGKTSFDDISDSDEYPYEEINNLDHLNTLFTFNLPYKYSLYYSLIENDVIEDKLLCEHLLEIVKQSGGLNLDVLKQCDIDCVPFDVDKDDIQIVEKISLNCPNIIFDFEKEFYSKRTDEYNGLIEEIKYEIINSSKFNDCEISNIANWFSGNNIYVSNLRRNIAIRTVDEGECIYLGRNVKTEKQVYDYIESLLKNNFNYTLKINKKINLYNRNLMRRIGDNRYEIKDALTISKEILEVYNNIEDEKRLLCEPKEFYGKVYGGYAKRCPCCGARVHTELTGFRIAKLRQLYSFDGIESCNLLIDVPCCQNCFDAFSYADEYKINIDSLLEENKIDIYVKLCDEIWRPNKFTPRLTHLGLIIKMNEDLFEYFKKMK